MKTLLFIHGFNGSKNSSTGKSLEKGLSGKYKYIAEDFNLLDVKGTLAKIKDLIELHHVDLLAGTSLGSFYVLASDFKGQKLVINPCMKPSEEIPKLHEAIDPSILNQWKDIETEIYDGNVKPNVSGIFATKDELFGEKYIPLFESNFGTNHFSFEGGHHGGNEKLSEVASKKIQ